MRKLIAKKMASSESLADYEKLGEEESDITLVQSKKLFDKKKFESLINNWADEYMNYKVSELFNGVSKDEASVVDKYIEKFGHFKDFSYIVESVLELEFDLDTALEKKFEIIKNENDESMLKDILESGAYNRNQVTIADLDYMDGIEFEYFLCELFKKMGFRAQVTKGSGDQGVDLILKDLNFKYAVQAKRYSDKVSNTAIQEAYTGMTFYNCNKSMVVTTNYFTKGAIELAKKNGVVIYDRDKLCELLEKYTIYRSDISEA